jgi:hypothetical protein
MTQALYAHTNNKTIKKMWTKKLTCNDTFGENGAATTPSI